MDGAFGRKQAEVEGGVNLEVLHVEPGGGAGDPRNKERGGGAEKCGLDGEDHIGIPRRLAQHDGQAAEHEGCEVRDALEAGGLLGDVKGSAVDDRLGGILHSAVFGPVELTAIVFADAPGGVVRGSSDDADLMAAGGEPGGHLACVLANAGEFGGVVEPVDQDSQTGCSPIDRGGRTDKRAT